jgi:hypothetical protein
VVDATGVGAPVVDLLRAAGIGERLVAVTITGSDDVTRGPGGDWRVPKRDLVTGLQVMLQSGELGIAPSCGRRMRWCGSCGGCG